MNIQKLLKEYRENRAKIRYFMLDVRGLEHLLELEPETHIESDKETIEGICLNAVALSDMPRSVTNKFHSNTETAAISYEKQQEYVTPSKPKIRQMIKDIESRIYPLQQQVKLVEDVLLPCLNVKEEYIIRALYIDEYSWSEIVQNYSDKFDVREERTLKDIRKYAFAKMESIISKSA